MQWTPADTIDFSHEGTYVVTGRLCVTDPNANTGSGLVVLRCHIVQ